MRMPGRQGSLHRFVPPSTDESPLPQPSAWRVADPLRDPSVASACARIRLSVSRGAPHGLGVQRSDMNVGAGYHGRMLSCCRDTSNDCGAAYRSVNQRFCQAVSARGEARWTMHEISGQLASGFPSCNHVNRFREWRIEHQLGKDVAVKARQAQRVYDVEVNSETPIDSIDFGV